MVCEWLLIGSGADLLLALPTNDTGGHSLYRRRQCSVVSLHLHRASINSYQPETRYQAHVCSARIPTTNIGSAQKYIQQEFEISTISPFSTVFKISLIDVDKMSWDIFDSNWSVLILFL